MLQQLWSDIRGLFVRAPSPSHFAPRLPRADPPAMHVDLQAPPDYVGSLISGFLCVIAYRDAKGQQSVRRITCQQIISAGGHAYLNAFCHERRARRQFRVDRIAQLIDIHTGEVTDDPGRFLASFAIDRKTASGLSWGLSVRQKADLVAGLNAMVFMGRCDKEWHPLERSALERFVASFWIQSELRGDAPLGDILDHAERLTPDAETFFAALARCAENRMLARIIRRHLQAMVDADGVLRSEELYWGCAVDDYFTMLAAND